ncbi:ubiquitin carboxyl-terminal hydrolase 48-like [Tympanuchus pallidicinctus]|uniref:ubiquitin carboxyl-terminal hydrolase 48-like n=1 Tax=Tympanuchus pallidicinctus TaxID=109042 RepID=UPI002286EAB3|nr:ubiquitin carboxyl-terminal hydrolase 48-like [Tympanuchus pallidicinctus]
MRPGLFGARTTPCPPSPHFAPSGSQHAPGARFPSSLCGLPQFSHSPVFWGGVGRCQSPLLSLPSPPSSQTRGSVPPMGDGWSWCWSCRRNCRGNPNCLVGIGEHVWLGEIDENSFHNIDDPNCERRKKNAFVGLTNLGAMCYVNTFLQMWFLNLELRQALYLCSSNEHTVRESIPKEPQTICEHLQYLFALLQNSRRRYIDPSGFVKALGLDTGQQQDAQEFSKLFMSLLEDTLSKQENPGVRNIVQKQFCGEYVYVTVCNQCGRESKLVSKFYELELNIQGHKQLTDCITEFLKEEKLEGDNRYFCETCQSKQNATRKIRLLSLPCTLNLQLMRFMFDRQTRHKKKLNTYIGFSELLDMEPFMEQKNGVYVYELSAVLIHQGVSAYSGHYIAHVKDPRKWPEVIPEEV